MEHTSTKHSTAPNQPKKPVGPDTMYFDALRGRRIRYVFVNDTGSEPQYGEGTMLDWDKYGIVVEKAYAATGPIYVFKAALAEIYPID
jgi:hypothetical protein